MEVGMFRRFFLSAVLAAIMVVPAIADSVEIEDGDFWAVVMSDSSLPEAEHGILTANGIAIGDDAAITGYPSEEEGLMRLSSAMAEKLARILYSTGGEGWMGTYMYDGTDGRYAAFFLAPADGRALIEASADYFMSGLGYQGEIVPLSDLMDNIDIYADKTNS